ncbi:MAG: RNA polymerase sigma factor [Acidobacteria bacterium]|nr:RNA polymerase sigma factor [Acidobacteriota bacterium]
MLHPVEDARATPLVEVAESELISRAIAGEGTAFEVIMRRHNRLLFRSARSILRNDADAEDAVQEAYLSAWRALPRFKGQSKLSTWLVRITLNKALKSLSRGTSRAIPLEDAMSTDRSHPHAESATSLAAALATRVSEGPEPRALRAELRRLVEASIDRLPDIYRPVFILREVEEMSVEDVAQALGILDTTVRTRVFRAKHLLREALQDSIGASVAEVFSFDGGRCERIVAQALAKARAEGLSRS